MVNIKKIIKAHYSPSNTTKKVVNIIADNFEGPVEEYNILNIKKDTEIRTFEEDELLIIGVPIFAGRMPQYARSIIENFKGNNTPAIAIANYGNANIGDCLLELVDLLKENGFKILAASTPVSQHSLFTKVAAGRPDAEDTEKLNDFAAKCIEKLENDEFNDIEVPGNRPYVELKDMPWVPICDETLCTFCYDCVSICPNDAISDDDPVETDASKCDACTACVAICQDNARSFNTPAFEEKEKEFSANFAQRKEPEFYL